METQSPDPRHRSLDPEPEIDEVRDERLAPTYRTYDVSQKADLTKRFLAALVDGGIALVLSWAFGTVGALLGGAYMLVRDGLDYEFMDRRSVGKKLAKLRPISLEGKPMDLDLSVRRNWPLALGYLGSFLSQLMNTGFWGVLGVVGLVEAVLVLTNARGRRYGDRFANTQVVESDD